MSVVDQSGLTPGRVGAIAVGLAVLALGGLSIVTVDPLAGVVDAAVERAGHDYVVAAALGAIAVFVGAMVLASGRGATMRQTEMPTVERPVPAPAAGDPFDRTVASWRFAAPVVGRSERSAVRERLRAAAVATIVADEGCSRRAARRQIEQGSWTDDRVASGFLAATPSTIGTWLVAATRGETAPQYRADRTVAVIRDRRERGRRARGEQEGKGPGSSTR